MNTQVTLVSSKNTKMEAKILDAQDFKFAIINIAELTLLLSLEDTHYLRKELEKIDFWKPLT